MMNRSMVGIVLSITLIFGLLPASSVSVNAQEELIVLGHDDVVKELQRPSVNFFHERHAEIYSNCTECHHIYQDVNGKRVNVWQGEPQKCSQCHKAEQKGKIIPIKAAYHDNCITCHRRVMKDGGREVPIGCGECHVRPDKLRAPHFVSMKENRSSACSECHVQEKAN